MTDVLTVILSVLGAMVDPVIAGSAAVVMLAMRGAWLLNRLVAATVVAAGIAFLAYGTANVPAEQWLGSTFRAGTAAVLWCLCIYGTSGILKHFRPSAGRP